LDSSLLYFNYKINIGKMATKLNLKAPLYIFKEYLPSNLALFYKSIQADY